MTRTPASIPGLLRWGRADDAGVPEDAAVSSILDRVSGSAYLPFSTAGPIYSTAGGANGQPYLRFDGVRGNALRDVLATDWPTSGYTVWAVHKRSGTGGTNAVVIGADDSTSNSQRVVQLGHTSTASARLVSFTGSGGVARIESTPVTHLADTILTGIAAPDGSELFANGSSDGASVSNAAAGLLGGSRRLSVGNLSLVSSSYNYLGRVYEWGVYDHTLTADERAQLHSYLQDRYGIPVADYVPEYDVWSRWDGAATQRLILDGIWDGATIRPAGVTKL